MYGVEWEMRIKNQVPCAFAQTFPGYHIFQGLNWSKVSTKHHIISRALVGQEQGLGFWLLTSVWIPGTPCSAKAWGHWERRNAFYRLLQGAVDWLALDAHSSNVICFQGGKVCFCFQTTDLVISSCQGWWCTPSNGWQMEVDFCEFKVSLLYIARSRTVGVTQRPCLQQQEASFFIQRFSHPQVFWVRYLTGELSFI